MCMTLSNLSFAYPGERPILDGISLAIEHGDFVMVCGPSGSGKSSFLRVLCRLEEPQSGDILLDGANITTIDPPRYRRKVALIQQTPTLVDGTVRDNILLPYEFGANQSLEAPDESAMRAQLDHFLLDVELEKDARSLSVGQAQRLCIIRSLFLEPQVLLMDEPTSALDAKSSRIVMERTAELNERGVTVIMVSHADEQSCTMHFGSAKVLTIENGKAELR